MMVWLNLLCELGFACTVLSVVLAFLPVTYWYLLTGSVVAAICVSKKDLKAALALVWLLVPSDVYSKVAYVLMLAFAYTQIKTVAWGAVTEQFSLYWKIFTGMVLFVSFIGKTEFVSGFLIPDGVMTMGMYILLMRSLRHQKEVYESAKFQRNNLLWVCGIGVLVLVLSSSYVIDAVMATLGFVYNYGIVYVLYLIAGIVWIVLRLAFSLISGLVGNGSSSPSDFGGFGGVTEEVLPEMTVELVKYVWLKVLAGILGVILIAAVVYWLYRYLQRLPQRRETSLGGYEIRTTDDSVLNKHKEESSDVQAVRKSYRKALQTLRDKQGLRMSPSDTATSLEPGIADLTDYLPLKRLYWNARYANRADKTAVIQSKTYVKNMKK
ncbi:MAG: hypothetical protein HUJ58_08710 [Erysipelotrichaceae bacterium]|nr:hypothetical protein [Erysipelotrichaceae bacterium]